MSMLFSVCTIGCTRSDTPTEEDDNRSQRTQEQAEGELSPVPVKLMTREADHDWSRFFESDTVEILGNGSYSVSVNISGAPVSIIPNLAISAVGTTVEDAVNDSAVKAPDEYAVATVTVSSVTTNGGSVSLTLTDNEDIPLIPDSGSNLHGYANVQMWNAWWQPNQRISLDENVSIAMGSGDLLEFSQPVSSIEVEFTVNGVLAAGEAPPETSSPVTASTVPPITVPPNDNDFVPSGNFNANITSEELVKDITLGWNLGNTLDAYYSENPSAQIPWADYDNMHSIETAWLDGLANVTTQALIKRVKDAGFNAIRVPVTWYKMSGTDPDYTIRKEWLDHVQEIVDMVAAEDMYIILNTHHDEFILRFDEDAAVGERVMKALWTQIGERFKGYDEKLIFEGLNEPRRRTNDWNSQGQWDWNGNQDTYNAVNRWNQAFVNAVRETGGNNQKRHLMLATYAAQGHQNQLDGFKLPTDPVSDNGISRFILSVHIYSPHHWAHNGNGNYGGETAVKTDLERVANRASALGVPVIFGEFGTLAKNAHDERVQHAGDYIKIATQMRKRSSNPVVMACFWWDDHGSFRLISRTNDIDSKGLEIIGAMTNARNS
jgi:endoglucanase